MRSEQPPYMKEATHGYANAPTQPQPSFLEETARKLEAIQEQLSFADSRLNGFLDRFDPRHLDGPTGSNGTVGPKGSPIGHRNNIDYLITDILTRAMKLSQDIGHLDKIA